MPTTVDLTTFKPENAGDLLDAIFGEVATIVTSNFKSFKQEVSGIVTSIAHKAMMVARLLADGQISLADADFALHTQEVALSSVLLYSRFIAYDIAEDVRSAVFKVVVAAIRNLTGISFNF
jgi:hypothetical protein